MPLASPSADAGSTPEVAAPASAGPRDAAVAFEMPPASDAALQRIADAYAWADIVAAIGLKGPAKVLAEHSVFVAHDGDVLRLALSDDDALLQKPGVVAMLAQSLSSRLGAAPQVRFEAATSGGESLRERNERAKGARQAAAEDAFLNDPHVQRLMQQGARLVPDSIRPLDEP